MYQKIIFITCLIFLSSCAQKPDDIQPITNFNIDRYLGTWYEIARLDHSFERDSDYVTAKYSKRDDGGITVVNRGLKKGEWDQANGVAYFVEEPTTGFLKVSFFRPFYGAYVIFKLDKSYQYVYITSSDKDYLWLLARKPIVSEQLKKQFVSDTKKLGFNTDALIWVKQSNKKSAYPD
jgi:apolipoprotein D and lipocalin family protein